jgi:hypothetical protein
MLQELSNVLRSLGLRNDADTVKAVNSVIPTVNQIDPFPYTGNALIDGTLNINFTDTLDTVMGEVDYIISYEEDERIQCDFIGQTYRDGDLFGFVGLFDGIKNIGGGTFEIPVNQWMANFIDEDNEVVIGAAYGFIDFTSVGGNKSIQAIPLKFEIPGELFEISAGVTPSTGNYIFEITKDGPNGTVRLDTNSNQAGFEVTCDGVDDEDTVFNFLDNNDDSLFTILGQFITSQNILDNRNYADDAAAEADGVPEGAFYHTNGVLKIRRPL